jgi:hypothetical protein
MRYEIPYLWNLNRNSPASKGSIPDHLTPPQAARAEWAVCDATNDAEAYNAVVRRFESNDARPIKGRENVGKWVVSPVALRRIDLSNIGHAPLAKLPRYALNDLVVLHVPYLRFRIGKIVTINGVNYGLLIRGFDQIVDFNIRRFAKWDGPEPTDESQSLTDQYHEKLLAYVRCRENTRRVHGSRVRVRVSRIHREEEAALLDIAEWVEEQIRIVLDVEGEINA